MALVRRQAPADQGELIAEMNAELAKNIVGVNWNFSQNIRDNVMESLSGVKGDNSVKIIGPDLDELEQLADEVKTQPDSDPRHRQRRHVPHQGAAEPRDSQSIRRSATTGA